MLPFPVLNLAQLLLLVLLIPKYIVGSFPGKSSVPSSSAETSTTVASNTTTSGGGFPNILSDLSQGNQVFQVPVLKRMTKSVKIQRNP